MDEKKWVQRNVGVKQVERVRKLIERRGRITTEQVMTATALSLGAARAALKRLNAVEVGRVTRGRKNISGPRPIIWALPPGS